MVVEWVEPTLPSSQDQTGSTTKIWNSNPRSGHMPGSPVGRLQKAANECLSFTWMLLSLSFSLPSPLSQIKNKNYKLKEYIEK